MPRLTASIWVKGPAETVFRVIESPPGPLLPVSGPELILLDPEPGLGARYRWEFRRLGLRFRADSVIAEYRPFERIAYHGTAGWEMEALANLTPEGEGTRLALSMRFRFPPPVRWLIPGTLIRLGVWHGLNRVKHMVETASPSPS